MTKTKGILVVMYMILLFSLPAYAEDFNIDFGSTYPGLIDSSFGGAAEQPGTWNPVTGFIGSGLMDINGLSTDVSYLIEAASIEGFEEYGGSGNSNGSILVDDNFYSSSGKNWSVSFNGFDSGIYNIFYYGPAKDSVNTGSLSVNGTSANSVSGYIYTSSFIKGTHYDVAENVVVDDGTLTLISSDMSGTRGLAGMQVVQVAVAPEPVSSTLFIIGGATLGFRRFRKKK